MFRAHLELLCSNQRISHFPRSSRFLVFSLMSWVPSLSGNLKGRLACEPPALRVPVAVSSFLFSLNLLSTIQKFSQSLLNQYYPCNSLCHFGFHPLLQFNGLWRKGRENLYRSDRSFCDFEPKKYKQFKEGQEGSKYNNFSLSCSNYGADTTIEHFTIHLHNSFLRQASFSTILLKRKSVSKSSIIWAISFICKEKYQDIAI